MDYKNLQILNWKTFSETNLSKKITEETLKIFEEVLCHRIYLVDDELSDADRYIFTNLSKNIDFINQLNLNLIGENLNRYFNHLSTLNNILINSEVKNIKIIKEIVKKEFKSESNSKFEDGGKFIGLKNAENQQICVRFPPEASGYLHIGHAKAALINQHYKDHYRGSLILRFDDTNPAKESCEFEHAILEDIKKLGINYDKLTYTSDHFDTLMKYCEEMIIGDYAYVDNTDPETMKKQRELCQESLCRSQSVEENLKLWKEMKIGSEIGKKCCVRVKFDMNSKNGCMRDPTIYRCKAESHVRTLDKYKVYPTYDFACPIVDSIEGVSHSLRTSEYNDRNEQFNSILDIVGLRKPYIADYSRLSLQNTVLSKRKLTWIVDNGYVDGWDDPRMPTVRGIIRHGMTVEGLKEFVIVQGFGRANVVMEWDKIWAFNKKVIDPVAPRFTGLSGSMDDLVIVNICDQVTVKHDLVARHPKNDQIGNKNIWYTPKVLVERSDANDFVEGSNVTFVNWGNIKIDTVVRNSDKTVTSVNASLNLEDRDFKKTLKVTWLPMGENIGTYTLPISVITYGDLISKNILDKDDDFKNFINISSKKEECMLGDIDMKNLKKGDIIQIQRKGYFICDEEYEEKSILTGYEYPLVLINIPEGNKKERVTTGMKVKNIVNNGNDINKADIEEPKSKKVDVSKPMTNASKVKNSESKVKDNDSKLSKVKKSAPEVKPNVQDISVDKKSESIVKKQTRLGLEATKEDNLADWYAQVITKSEMLDYYDISGCYILRPLSASIWKTIQVYFGNAIELKGVNDCNFPMFISKDCLEKEKEHISDFSPEVAWIMKCGDKLLEKPIAIRPTSETSMYPYFAKWIQSYRDLPLKLNQWCNVVRWELKNPMPFLRSREFLWQEGHTAYSNQEDAIKEVYDILNLYEDVYKSLLAIPVVKGRKTEKEKFAGSDFTTTTEIYIKAAGRAIQGATSHHLGQNFSKMFDVTFENKDGKLDFVYQNSWGLTTRTLGILVMVHGDNKGLVLPPKIANIQMVIVPCGVMSEVLEGKCTEVAKRLKACCHRVYADLDEQRKPGWKFNHWELKGVPIRIEIGPRDIENNTAVLCYRYNGEKETINVNDIEEIVSKRLESVQQAMFDNAKVDLDEHRVTCYTMSDLCKGLDNKMLITAPFCGDKKCEDDIKLISARDSVVEEGAPSMGAKSLCIPIEQPKNLGTKCVRDSCTRLPMYFTMFGRSY